MTSPIVTIRPVEDDDLPILYENQTDPVAAAMAVVPTRNAEAFFEHWAMIRATPRTTLRTILADDAVVGYIVCWMQDDAREVGYWIGREHWGRGYATAALRLLLAEMPDRPIVAHVVRDNIGSQRVLEHCGFVRTGETESDDGVVEVNYGLD